MAWLNFDSRELIRARVLMLGGLGAETISRMMVCLTTVFSTGLLISFLFSASNFSFLNSKFAPRGSGLGTGTGVGDGFDGIIFKGEGSTLGILTLSSATKSLIKLKFLEFIKLEKRLAPKKMSVKLKSPAKTRVWI